MTTVIRLLNGRFDVQDDNGISQLDELGGPFRLKETAESAHRMIIGFDTVDTQIEAIIERLRDV